MIVLNYWHYIFLGITLLIFLGGVYLSLIQKDKKLIFPMFFSVTLVSSLLVALTITVVDKYTKKVELSKVKNKRLLSTEEIVYTGYVKNVGDHPVSNVYFEVKLVNRGRATGNVKGGNFYKPKGFSEFFSQSDKDNKPQTITKTFLVSKYLEPGNGKRFRVYFKFPGYFRNVAEFSKVETRFF